MNDRMNSAAEPSSMPQPASTPTRHADGSAHGEWSLGRIVDELREQRRIWRRQQQRSLEYGVRELPSLDGLRRVVEQLKAALFPLRLGPSDLRQEGEDYFVGSTIDAALTQLQTEVRLELQYSGRRSGGQSEPDRLDLRSRQLVHDFALRLPELRGLLDSDVVAAYQGDPAAHSVDEVLLSYPGVSAMIHHRIAHELYLLGVPMLARMVAEIAHSATGIDIHPGATIGRGFFIDHGTGVVIGETAIIGERVRLYQNVTLGAKRFPVGENGELVKSLPRHPIVEDDVVVYAGATILGRVTVGRGSTIGGNVWLTRSVPPGSQITQASCLDQAPCGEGGSADGASQQGGRLRQAG